MSADFVPESFRLAVKHGAAFLDVHEPGWEHRLDLDSLQLADACQCVIGQLKGDYDDGAVELGLDPHGPRVVDLGFLCRTPMEFDDTPSQWNARVDDNWTQLTQAWRDLVSERLS